MLCLIKGRPRIIHPRLRQGDHAESLGDLVATADDVSHLLGELRLIGTVSEQLVVARVGHELGARILFLAEQQLGAFLMDVEAVLDDGGQLDLEGVVIYRLATGDVQLQCGGIGSGEVAHGNRAQPQCADDFLQVWRNAGVVVPRLLHRDDVLLRLLAQRAVVLVGDGFEQRADPRGVVVQPEVGGGEHGHGLATALVEVGEDADQIARFLRVGGDEHLFFEQAQQVRRVGPRFSELPALAFLLGGRHIEQPEGFGDVLRDQRFDGAAGDLQAVVEQTVQQHPAAIQLDALGAAARLEVDGDRVDAMHLLVGVAAAVAHRDHQHQQVGALLGDLRKNLDEVERPVLPRVLLGVGQAVVPRLEFVQQQHRRLVLQQLDDELVRRDFGLGRALAVPLALDEGAVRMVLEQDIPQEFVAVAMQAFADDVHPVAQRDLADAGVGERGCPCIEP